MLRLHPMARDVGLTAATEVTVFATGLILIGFIGRSFGHVALSEYLLVRRVCAWLQTGAMLGLGVAIARYTARAKSSHSAGIEYFAAGMSCLMAAEGSLVLALCLAPRLFSHWLFGNAGMKHLLVPLACLLLGMGGHAGVYAYLRGCLRMVSANALQCCHGALIPFAATAILSGMASISVVMTVIGLSNLFVAGLFALPLLGHMARITPPLELFRHMGELLRYGVARVPGDFGSAALFTIGPVVAAHLVPVAQLLPLLLGTSMLMAVSLGSAPLGVVLLSKVSQMLADGRIEEVRSQLIHLFMALMECSVLICLQFLVFGDLLIRFWVGRESEKWGVIRILALAIPFYLCFTGLRSAIDAATPRAYNARNVLISLAVFGGMTALAGHAPMSVLVEAVASALVLALAVLAILTAHTLQNLYQIRISWRKCAPGIALGGILGAASLLFRLSTPTAPGLPVLACTQMIVWTVFLLVLWKLRSPWLTFVVRAASSRPGHIMAGREECVEYGCIGKQR